MKIRILTAALAALLLIPLPTVTAYAGGGTESGETVDAQAVEEIITEPEETTGGMEPEIEENPFTPSGTGTVVNTATDEDGKEFYTIITPDENVFYLVIDRQRSTENVYFLNAVTEADLMSLAEISETAEPEPLETTPAPVETEEPEPDPEPEKSGGMDSILLVVLILLIGGGAGWYFKIYKVKQAGGAMDDEYAEEEAGLYDIDEADPYGGDSDDDPWPEDDGEAGDDSLPWDEDDAE